MLEVISLFRSVFTVESYFIVISLYETSVNISWILLT